ncbi:MAG: alpha/beta fold hydrolase [Myxococcota bacterium]
MATFLLIHGAWHGAWCWERLVPLLRERGHRVAAIDLPAHGDDRGWALRATLGRYAQRVQVVAEQLSEPPILVGHSMGGLVMTQAAHDAPDRYAALFYLCAFVPVPGERMIDLARLDPDSRVAPHTRIRPPSVRFHADGVREAFCAECSDDDVALASQRLRREPLLPMFQRIRARQPLLPARAYIECTRDQAISIGRQRAMCERAGIERVASLDTDHSPFLSAPEALARALHDLASRGP